MLFGTRARAPRFALSLYLTTTYVRSTSEKEFQSTSEKEFQSTSEKEFQSTYEKKFWSASENLFSKAHGSLGGFNARKPNLLMVK